MNAKIATPHAKKTWPFYWISRVDQRYVQVLEKRLKPMGLDAPRWRVLMSLHEDTYLSVSEIAEFSAMRLNTTTKVVQRLIADGLVTTRVRPTDARATEVTLTLEGERMGALALVEARDIFELAFRSVSNQEMDVLNGILEKVFSQLKRM
ncbi:MarR family winged helix-turn-helix transcriptional regulator [Ciceribacter sp. RN22]|uniref:MarR family winged helix-turn-helix transcriptional regulator n=1 Tax=Ciceribacter sp. RN22 TaxID=2954932 RepID=UPI002093EE6E|nr:MarR family transcriptional regulator [Ciceribacter sp. RN22]MCO6181093.1 MarR family transcriptional regulator [Ciceribacter sp. RN22]